MKLKTFKQWAGLLILLVSFGLFEANAQAVKTPVEEWTTQEGTQYLFHQSSTVTDASSNVYKTGATVNGNGNYDIITVKYNSSGVQQWVAQYAGAGGGDDVGAQIAIDGSGNVFVVGTYYANSTDSNNCILIKYNPSGTQQWTATYDGGQGRGDAGANLIIDSSNGDIYVCGSTYANSTTQYDFLLLKYNSSGTQQWASRWDNANLWDGAYLIALKSGLVTISGGTQINSTRYDYASAQWTTGGTFSTSSTAGGSNPIGFNKITGMVTDASGNIYITGAVLNSNYDYLTMKLDANLGQLWTATYNGSSNLDDAANDIQVDASGNVYVTGYSTTSTQGTNFVTVKYNSSGAQQWAVTYNGSPNGDDEGSAIAIGSGNEVYLTGWTFNGVNKDYLTMRVDPSNGSTIWSITYNSHSNADDRGTDIALDNAGALIVTGQGQDITGQMAYNTVKYKEIDVITPPDTLLTSWQFIENRGQLRGTDTLAAASVKFYNDFASPMVYFNGSTLNYVYSNVDTISTDTDSLVRVDLTFSNSINSSIYALEKRPDYFSYFNALVPDGKAMVPLFKRLIRPETYSNIDVMYASSGSGMRIYFIIKPGGKPGDIEMAFSGSSGVSVGTDGSLTIATALGNIVYPKATAFEINSSGNRVNLAWQPTFNIPSANNVNFASIGSYTATNTLVLELNFGPPPTVASYTGMVWGTYYGGASDDDFRDVKVLAEGSAIACGASSSSDWPVTTGVVQSTTGGNWDMAVAKFDSIGVRQWATYYGGTGLEWADAEVLDSMGVNIMLTGQTSSANFPTYDPYPSTTSGPYYDGTINGSNDIFLVKLNASGTARLWATYYGGTGNDRGYDIVRDRFDNTFIVGFSTTSFPTQAKTGAYNNSTQTGQTGAILKFNVNDSLVWATRFPCQRIHGALTTFNNNYFYIIGNTDAATLPIYNPNPGTTYVDSTFGGVWDAFITGFDLSDTIRWSTHLGGTSLDEGRALTKDNNNNIIAVGVAGNSTFPYYWTGSPAYIDSTASGSDAFIAKFNTQFKMTWATFFGGAQQEWAFDVCADNNTFYVTGSTASPTSSWSNLQAPNAFYQTDHNFTDSYILAFKNATNERTWTTYYSGTSEDLGDGIDVDKTRNNLFMVGSTNSKGNGATTWNLPVQNNQYSSAYFFNLLNAAPNAQSQSTAYYDGYIAAFNTLPVIEVGITEISPTFNYDVALFPNPTVAQINIVFELTEQQEVEVNVFNLLGERINSVNLGTRSGKVTELVDLSAYSNGVYIIQVKIGNEAVSKKVIKQY